MSVDDDGLYGGEELVTDVLFVGGSGQLPVGQFPELAKVLFGDRAVLLNCWGTLDPWPPREL